MMRHLTDATIDLYVKKQLPRFACLAVKLHMILCRECWKKVRQYHDDETFIGAFREGFGKMNSSFSNIQEYLNKKEDLKQEK